MIYPIVRYVIQRGDRYVADDRHSDYDAERIEPLGNPFICEWDTPEQALEHARAGDVIRVVVDGALVPISPDRLSRIRAELDETQTVELVPWSIDERLDSAHH